MSLPSDEESKGTNSVCKSPVPAGGATGVITCMHKGRIIVGTGRGGG